MTGKKFIGICALGTLSCGFATLAMADELPNDSDTQLLLRFDGNLLGEDGESATASGGTSFVEGLVGDSVHIARPGGFVRYDKVDNIDPSEGTVEFWLRPDWDGDQDLITRLFFSAGSPFNNGMIISIDGANNLRFIQWGDDPDTAGKETNVERGVWIGGGDLEADTWYHLAVTWTGGASMSFYRDGQVMASRDNGVVIDDFTGPSVYVGADINGGGPAEGAIDEFRISDRQRSDGEILGDYYAGLGIHALMGPSGLDVDWSNRTVVVESAAQMVSVFEEDGAKLFGFGGPGSGNGELNTPWDVAIDSTNRIYVVDSGNNRVQVFDDSGAYLSQFGSFGTAPGRFAAPQGIHIDSSTGKIYVADTGNHRVQRFNANGTLDTGWANGGVAGTTGVVKRDHTGFDSPTNMAVHPVTGQLYVTDFGNHRLEIFDSGGNYAQTYLVVYRPNGLAFDASGNLYVAGEDPNNKYTYMDGRLRFLRQGQELSSRHYTGGLDDLGRILSDVALRRDGSIVFVDSLNARIVKTDSSFSEPVTDLTVDARGTEVVFRWRTAQPWPSTVSYGLTSSLGSEAGNPTPTTHHEVTVQGLTPGTRLAFSLAFPDTFDGSNRWTPVEFLSTGATSGQMEFLRLKSAGLIYRDTNAGTGFTPMSSSQRAKAYEHFQELSRFYWINSGFRLWLDYTIVEVDRDIDGCLMVWDFMEEDLESAGFGAGDDFDAVHAGAILPCGYFGGGGSLFGRGVGVCQWGVGQEFVAIHEANHSIDSIYASSSLPKYEFNHGIWAVPGGVGRDFTINGQIVRNMLPVSLTATDTPFTKTLTAPDADNDRLPDTSPTGLTNALVITENSFGSSSSAPDSDGDGLSDRDEAMALVYHSIDPMAWDSDGDASNDTVDLNPAYPIGDVIEKSSPRINGVIDPADGWTVFTNKWGYSNDALVYDSDAFQDDVKTYLAWDDDYLYIALKGPPSLSNVYLDGGADGWFLGSDNYRIRARNDTRSLLVNVNVGVPDLFRQIDNDGQYSYFLDTDPQFTKPYRGRTIYDNSDDGLGFPGRLVSESDLDYDLGGSGNNSVWEVAIPWSDTTALEGYIGKRLGVEIYVGDDKLFETDHAPVVVLTDLVSSIAIVMETTPADGTDFYFTGDLGSFQLDDDSDPALDDRASFSPLPPGTYRVGEYLPPNWIVDEIVCDDGSPVDLGSATATISLLSGEDVACTFSNRRPPEPEIFSDDFESGDTSAWSPERP